MVGGTPAPRGVIFGYPPSLPVMREEMLDFAGFLDFEGVGISVNLRQFKASGLAVGLCNREVGGDLEVENERAVGAKVAPPFQAVGANAR